MRNRTYNMVLVGLFAALTAVGAFLKIPLPPPFPAFTFQIFFVVMAGLMLGWKLGFASQMIYLILGLVGIPIFAEGGGFHYIFKPSFGFLIGFALAALVTGLMSELLIQVKYLLFRYLVASLAGLMVCYAVGVPYIYLIVNFYFHKAMSLNAAITAGFTPFFIWDVIKMVIASMLSLAVVRRIRISKV